MIAHHTNEDGTLKPLAEKKWKELEDKKQDYIFCDFKFPKLFVFEKLQKVMKAFGTTLKDASTFQLSLTDTTNYRYMDELRTDLEKCCTWHGRHKPKTLGTVLKTVLSRMGINLRKNKDSYTLDFPDIVCTPCSRNLFTCRPEPEDTFIW